MSDIRDDLNARMNVLRAQFSVNADIVRTSLSDSRDFATAQRNIQELRDIESTIATMQLADAQDRVAKSQLEVASQQQAANTADAAKRSANEESSFWARRFLTSITVANLGGFVAVVLFLSKSDSPLVDISDVSMAIRTFALGTAIGGIYPLAKIAAIAIWKEKQRPLHAIIAAEFMIPFISAVCLISGSITATDAAFMSYQSRIDAMNTAATAHSSSPNVAPAD